MYVNRRSHMMLDQRAILALTQLLQHKQHPDHAHDDLRLSHGV
jgi:hypothetical protein